MRRFCLSACFGFRACFGFAALALGPTGFAQVDIGQLGAAQRYDSEPLNPGNGGLDPALWQGVSAGQASAAIETVDISALSELPYRFMRRVLLSAGVPPEGDERARDQYLAVKTRAKLQLQDYTALNSLSDLQNPQQRQARFRVELALASGDKTAACRESDREIDNRSAPFWMQMRIICHIIRGEEAAAELTLNLMRSRDDINPDFIGLSDTALGLRSKPPQNWAKGNPVLEALSALISPDEAATVNDYTALALDAQTEPNARLEAMFKTKNRLTPQQIQAVMSALLYDTDDLAGGASFDIDTALAGLQSESTRAKSTAQLFNLAANYSDPQSAAQAVAALLNLSETAGYTPQMTQLLSDALPFISPEDQARLDARRFSWAALRRGDLSTLRGLYQGLDENDPLRGRIALTSDALGNGFLLGPLGLDIETRLDSNGAARDHALRDAVIGLALGAQMSEKSAAAFYQYDSQEPINPLRLAAINSAAKSGARALVLMQVAQSMGAREVADLSTLEVYTYIAALSEAGLSREAGELAAYDFMSRIPDAPEPRE